MAIPCHVVLPDIAPSLDALSPMWARERIGEWTSQMLGVGASVRAEMVEKITATALASHLVSDATSLVCVDEDSYMSGAAEAVSVASETPADTR